MAKRYLDLSTLLLVRYGTLAKILIELQNEILRNRKARN